MIQESQRGAYWRLGAPIIHSLRDQTPPLCDPWMLFFSFIIPRHALFGTDIFVSRLDQSDPPTRSGLGLRISNDPFSLVVVVFLYPIHSMYAIYAYIDPSNHPNVGIYGIHGASGL